MSEQLVAGYNRFREGYYKENKEILTELAKGQSPKIAVVSCCDSRVDPNIIFDAKPGDLFVIRNVANLVPECENDGSYHGTSSALEFAVTGLKVSHIVVLGHAKCGGVKALMDRKEEEHEKASFIDHWMEIAETVKHNINTKDIAQEEKYTECEKSSIAQSLENLMTFPWIKTNVEQGKLTLCGWYYDLDTATLSSLNNETGEFECC